MIPTEYCDTQAPRNLEYSDFWAGMDALPPSRPLTDDTPVLYILSKVSVMAMFKKVVAHTQSLCSPTYDRTISLDLEAREVYRRVPDKLQRRDVARCMLDTPARILERCNIELCYLKALIVLHRRFVTYEPATPSFETSRRACAEAALDVLARQADLYQAFQPGGRLFEDRWMLAAVITHDFLLAAMVLCLDLSVRLRCDTATDDVSRRTYLALQTSRQVWASASARSQEARTAVFALDLMLRKVADKHAESAGLAHHAPLPAMDIFDMPGSSSGDALPYEALMSEVIDGARTPDWVSQAAAPTSTLRCRADPRDAALFRTCLTNIFSTQTWNCPTWRCGMASPRSPRMLWIWND
jgi:hypothetical protein